MFLDWQAKSEKRIESKIERIKYQIILQLACKGDVNKS